MSQEQKRLNKQDKLSDFGKSRRRFCGTLFLAALGLALGGCGHSKIYSPQEQQLLKFGFAPYEVERLGKLKELYAGCESLVDVNNAYKQMYSMLNTSGMDERLKQMLKASGENDLEPLKRIDTFAKFPFDTISAHLGLNGRTSFQLLYPGGGSHLSPLEIGIQLQALNHNLEVSRFVYTEVKEETLAEFESYIKKLKPDAELINISDKKNKGNGYEVTYSLHLFGRPIQVTYAMDTSETEKGDYSYFRREYATDSDIVLFHDTFSDHTQLPEALFYVMKNCAENPKPQVIIFDDMARVTQGLSPKDAYSCLPGSHIIVEGRYACRAINFNGAVVYFPDKAKLKQELTENSADLEKKVNELWVYR